MLEKIIISTMIGGIIGWTTNVLAIKMLFKPIEPIKIPFLKLYIHGLLPKRRSEIAISIGKIVSDELININDILKKLLTEENKEYAINTIKQSVKESVGIKIPPLVPSIIKNSIIDYVDEQVEKEIPKLLDTIIEDLYEKSHLEIDIEKMVEEKINEIDLIELEKIVIELTKKELKYIEVIGGILGAIIGCIQGIIINYLY